MKNPIFVLWLIVAALLTFVAARLIDNAYFYFARGRCARHTPRASS